MNHLYIDGSKFEANVNKYSWVWKKATEKSRYRLFAKITALFEKMNNELKYKGVKIQTNAEYTPESQIIYQEICITSKPESDK